MYEIYIYPNVYAALLLSRNNTSKALETTAWLSYVEQSNQHYLQMWYNVLIGPLDEQIMLNKLKLRAKSENEILHETFGRDFIVGTTQII